jgi:hypothetical protein
MTEAPEEATKSKSNKGHARQHPLRWFGIGVLVGVGLTFGLLLLLSRTVTSNREQARHSVPTDTESGYAFPAVADISEMNAGCEFWDGQQSFAVPQECWADILAALSPSERDREPGAWLGLGDLKIRTKQGSTVRVDFYSLEYDMTGAFSAGPTHESREYFRGGNTRKLEAALAKAFHVHLRSHGASPSDKRLNADGSN